MLASVKIQRGTLVSVTKIFDGRYGGGGGGLMIMILVILNQFLLINLYLQLPAIRLRTKYAPVFVAVAFVFFLS